ncbi:MAG: hypothetical protein Q7R57_02550, partial [Dehalococcoidales bacterium]|nr:hypothetical protein [Dehalococcoidales bacterium]
DFSCKSIRRTKTGTVNWKMEKLSASQKKARSAQFAFGSLRTILVPMESSSHGVYPCPGIRRGMGKGIYHRSD